MAAETRLLIERSWMLFVDGENFTKRGQDVLKSDGLAPIDGSTWRRDVFLWLPGVRATQPFIAPQPRAYFLRQDQVPPPSEPRAPSATRAYYYTSMPYESEAAVTRTRLELRQLGFEPRMFPRRQGKSKAVDIALATDALTLAGENRYEVAVIVAGDGDYVPVVEAVKRLGRHVVVGFFGGEGQGLSDELRIAADEFVDLTLALIGRWREERDRLEREAAEAAKGAAESLPEA